ncbi:DEAD/DEAH box helicase [Sulfurimonas sp.]|uniref:DEAD/DEAH box helicase n=1 Tax=Sulfurimonas sp. TaxID=2022749 RepID=UPI003565FFA4
MEINLPKILNEEKINKNTVFQLKVESLTIEVNITAHTTNRVNGYIASNDHYNFLISPSKLWAEINRFDNVLYCKNLNSYQSLEDCADKDFQWLKHPLLNQEYTNEEINESWENSLILRKENRERSIKGLRTPQIGGIYSTLGHWETSNETATLVMPTGTGKTETMLSLLLMAQINKLLVIVPTDALRKQVSEKFINFGILKQVLGLLNNKALYPKVGVLKSKMTSEEDINIFFDNCNVIVSTAQIVTGMTTDLQEYLANKCSHLFIDEAHHVAAHTWKSFKEHFYSKKILQFTATPFRNDNKSLDGKIIFNYPLSKAQDEGYFREINFIPISEYDSNKYDKSIAEKAVEILREDINNGYNHVLMARVNSKARAQEVFEYYREYEEFNPVQIHTGINQTERNEIKRQIENLETQIIICVDMLGEGFDLPNLKVAAFHDIKKSLPITLQLAGRFTRDSIDEELGNASIIVNLATTETSEELEHLYAQNSDWNKLLPLMSGEGNREQEEFYDFIKGFETFPNELQLQNVRPALSCVIYKTTIEEWKPENFKLGIPNIDGLSQVYSDINNIENTLIIVTAEKSSVKWGKVEDVEDVIWSLYVLHWDKLNQLLFINCSQNNGLYKKLAEVVTNYTADLICAEDVFRCLGNINLLKINNAGLKEQLGKSLSYTMHTGDDVPKALSPSQLINKIKSNIFGVGYEDGEKISMGCSYKGRVWSMKNGNLKEFNDWCKYVGDKILNPLINIDDILVGAIITKRVESRPEKMPYSIEWNENILKDRNEETVFIVYDGQEYEFSIIDINLFEANENGNIKFVITCNDDVNILYELKITSDNFSIEPVRRPAEIKFGNTSPISLSNYLYEYTPIIRFVDGSWLEGNEFAEYKFDGSAYSRENIIVKDWTDVNIKVESQKLTRIDTSIQYKMIQDLMSRDHYNIVFDDDSSGEAADIVTLKVNDEDSKIDIELYHLKYSQEDSPGARIADLYEVCGQAQKSIFWRAKGAYALCKHLISREAKRISKTETTRFQFGTMEDLQIIKDKSKKKYRCDFKIFIVQPGLSKSKASEVQLELLAVTENYLKQTYQINLEVIGSN